MDDMNYKPNSHKAKEEQRESAEETKKVEKIVKGVVKTKKKSEISKFRDRIISDDARNIKSYIVEDVIIPAIKNTILDTIINSATIAFGGSRAKKNSVAGRVSYRNFYDRRDDRRVIDEPRSGGYSFYDITLESRIEAQEVLDRMDELIDRYRMVSVADLYDMVGVTGNYTDNKYGWTDISTARISRTREGFTLDLPRPKAL